MNLLRTFLQLCIPLLALASIPLHAQRTGVWDSLMTFPNSRTLPLGSISVYDISSGGQGHYVVAAQDMPAIGPHHLWLSDDGGESWRSVRTDELMEGRLYNDIATPTPSRIIAIGRASDGSGFVISSRDAGNSWRRTDLPRGAGAWELSMADSNHGVILGGIVRSGAREPDSVFVYSTIDGGDSWSSRSIDLRSSKQSSAYLTMPSPSTLLLSTYDVAAFGTDTLNYHLSRSTDGGATWAPMPSLPLKTYRLHFVDSLYGFAYGGEYTGRGNERTERIAKTTDGGVTWRMVWDTLRAGFGIHDMAFADRQHGVVSSNIGDILRTSDGGETWVLDRVPMDFLQRQFFFVAVAYPVPNEGITISRYGSFARYTGRSTLAAPQFLRPYGALANLPLDVTFEWTPIEGATSYDFQLGDTARNIQFFSYDPHIFDVPYLDRQGLNVPFIQTVLQNDKRYEARVRAHNPSGDTSDWTIIDVLTQINASVAEESSPSRIDVHPNPAGEEGWSLTLSLDRAANVRVSLADLSGREVLCIADRRLDAGRHELRGGEELPAGAYMLIVRDGRATRSKLVLKAE